LGAPEKYLGFWIGSMSVAILYFVCNIVKEVYHTNSLQLRGLNAIDNDSHLFWISVFFLVLVLAIHTYVVWISPDPGMIQTRESDFDAAMRDSMTAGGATPSSDSYCRTTLVKKPIRSKFCVGSGFVVARMDHYCVWLNNCVGHGNHVAFYFLLLFHIVANCCFEALCVSTLVREINTADVGNGWDVAEILFGRKLFYLLSFCIFLMMVSVGLVALFLEQTINITKNQTTNERMNAGRYAWMTDKAGKPCNRFDRGAFTNTLEFFGASCFAVDYLSVFVIPDSSDRRKGSVDEHRADSKLLLQGSPVRNMLHKQDACDDDHDHSNCSHSHPTANNGRASGMSDVSI
jgi:hypothetical protein